MNAAKNRKKLQALLSEETRLMEIFLDHRQLIKGGIFKAKTKCGNKNCKCAREGKLHEVWRYYVSRDGKGNNRTVKKGELIRLEKGTTNYKRFRRARARLVKLHNEQLRLIDALEKAKTKKVR